MTAIGHARVSTTGQDLSIQEEALRAAGCDTIRAEKRSGTSTQGREELLVVTCSHARATIYRGGKAGSLQGGAMPRSRRLREMWLMSGSMPL